MNDPRTWIAVWELTVRAEGGMVGGGQRGKNWDNCNKTTIKTLNKIRFSYLSHYYLYSLVIAVKSNFNSYIWVVLFTAISTKPLKFRRAT